MIQHFQTLTVNTKIRVKWKLIFNWRDKPDCQGFLGVKCLTSSPLVHSCEVFQLKNTWQTSVTFLTVHFNAFHIFKTQILQFASQRTKACLDHNCISGKSLQAAALSSTRFKSLNTAAQTETTSETHGGQFSDGGFNTEGGWLRFRGHMVVFFGLVREMDAGVFSFRGLFYLCIPVNCGKDLIDESVYACVFFTKNTT